MFSKILIANRGEIACRVIKTCRRMGISTVAVYSQADAKARHVRLADQAVCVGPAASKESYLRIEAIIEAARATGAQAIHPGYGFLSENEQFALACDKAGIRFIGPPVEAIRAMGSKSAAKALMQQAGVPLVPGYHGDDQTPGFLQQQADEIGYPVLIKASAGGGGKGMRVVENAASFQDALTSCQREARASFGDDRVLIEKYLQRPRHIEVQVFADQQGDVVSLHERDCSAQRRHQKVVEEAPAPGMSNERRTAMARAACEAARAVSYVGAGTVEFIAPEAGDSFYFMEMNTRLQVEHPVTEMITGLDLVEWQIRVAAGQALPLRQEQIPINGHSIEVRVYAEEPHKGFLPSVGRLVHLQPPAESAAIRVDTGVEQGDEISPHYDPMLAKLIVWGQDRDEAIRQMLSALGEYQVVGVGNNISFLSRLIDAPAFRDGQVDTGMIEREQARLVNASEDAPDAVFALAAAYLVERDAAQARAQSQLANDPWSIADGWRVNTELRRTFEFTVEGQGKDICVRYKADGQLAVNEQTLDAELDGERIWLRWSESRICGSVIAHQENLHVFYAGESFVLGLNDPLLHAGEDADEHGGFSAPMSGKIIAINVAPGDAVEKGTALMVMEAMKMEHSLCAPNAGKVSEFYFAVGDQVEEGAELLSFDADEK